MKLTKTVILNMISRAIDLQCLELNADKHFMLEDSKIEFNEGSIQVSNMQMNNKAMLLKILEAAITAATKSTELTLEYLRIKLTQRTDDGEWSYSEDTAIIEWNPAISTENLTVSESNYKCVDGEDAEEE